MHWRQRIQNTVRSVRLILPFILFFDWCTVPNKISQPFLAINIAELVPDLKFSHFQLVHITWFGLKFRLNSSLQLYMHVFSTNVLDHLSQTNKVIRKWNINKPWNIIFFFLGYITEDIASRISFLQGKHKTWVQLPSPPNQ